MPRLALALTRHGPAALGYSLATLLYTWPLAGYLGTRVPRDSADPLLSTWTLWWNATVLPFSAAWWNGPVFWPASGTLAFSDHRVGLALLTTPLQWAGVTPLGAYDVAVLATFVLCGLGVYALGLALTGHRAAAFLGGLVFAFHPVRAAHLEHLELLATYWVPVVFVCLHAWRTSRAWWALPGVSSSLILLALTSGYVFVFGGVLVAAWALWFARGVPRRDLARLGAALAAPLLIVGPVLWAIHGIHDAYGFQRTITEIEQLSADLVDFVAAPSLLAWWPGPVAPHPERALYPGVVAVALVAWAGWRAPRASAPGRVVRLVRRGSVAVCAIAGLVTLASLAGLDQVGAGPLRVSFRLAYKPWTFAVLGLAVWLLLSARVRAAWRSQAAGAFYALATVGLWLFALGPTAHAGGARVLYKAPYAWLMAMPGFAANFRAPARFALVAAFTLAVAVVLAVARAWPLAGGGERRAWALLAAALLADGWITPLPLLVPPAPLAMPAGVAEDTPLVELPLGTYEDAAAMYRATMHGHAVVNGLSGYEPAHYTVLRQALLEGDVEALAPLAAAHDVVAVVAATADTAALREALAAATFATALPATDAHAVFRLSPSASGPAGAVGAPVPIDAVRASRGDARAMLDDDPETAWTSDAQRGGEHLDLTLASPAEVAGVTLTQGRWCVAYPRALAVELSDDGARWQEVWRGGMSARTVAAALASPRDCPVTVTFAPRRARWLRLRQIATADRPWAVAGVRVLAAP